MVVKIKNGDKSWSYFECEIIHSKYGILKNFILIGGLPDSIFFLKVQPSNPKESEMNVKVLNLETQKSHLRTIVTDRVCYVLNSEGKTIDKI